SDFWLTQLSTDSRPDPELRIERGAEVPIVSVVGRAREGTSSLAALYEGFIHGLRDKLPKRPSLKERLTVSASKFTVDLSFFAPRPAFAFDPAKGSASNQYFATVSSVREELLTLAGRNNMRIAEDLGLPALSPTRESEIVRYLEALDLVDRAVRLALASGVDR